MNRELKFKFWNTENKTMSKSSYNLYDQYTQYDRGIFFNLEHEEYEVDTDHIQTGVEIPLQYTGVKDRMGVEIYEGDIVTWICNTCKDCIPIGFIVWHKEFCRFNVAWPTDLKIFLEKGYHGTSRFMNGENLEKLKVIGNIYENPELLEDK